MNSTRTYLCGGGQQGESRLAIINAANKDHLEVLLAKLDVAPEMLVLDVACGAGAISFEIAEKNPEAHVVGIDFDAEKIQLANQAREARKLTNTTFKVMSVYDIETLASEYQFDRIFIRWVLGHLQNPQAVIESCKKLLKPHGVLVCEEGNLQTHHCVSTNPAFIENYRFFVTKVELLQKKRGVDPNIGAKLFSIFKTIFPDNVEIKTDQHQLLLASAERKEAVTTSFLDETGSVFVDKAVLEVEELASMRENLTTIAHEDEAQILYTADVSVVVKKL